MNRLPLACLAVALLAAPAFGGEAEDAEYDTLVAAALTAPEDADYARIRELFAKTSYYQEELANPANLLGKYIVGGEPASQELKDEAQQARTRLFALPHTHHAIIAIMGYKKGMAQTDLHVAAGRGLLQAIVDSGDGEDAATARVVLKENEDKLSMEDEGVEWIRRMRQVEEGGRTYDVQKVRGGFWSGEYEVWYDTTAYSKPATQ